MGKGYLKLSDDGKKLIRCDKYATGTITIPDSVTKIDDLAFSVCTDLSFVEIPDSVTEIGYHAFWGCTGIREPLYNKHLFFYLPENFSGSYSIPKGINKVSNFAFSKCTDLTSIEIPNSVTEIENEAFGGCTGLTTIEIPNSVISIGEGAFSGCTNLTAIEIPNSVTEMGANILDFPEGVFQDCTNLTAIEIPASVTKIGWLVFEGCTNLTEIHIRNEHPEDIEIAEDAFNGCADHCTLYVPVGTGYAYRHHPIFGKFKEVIIEK